MPNLGLLEARDSLLIVIDVQPVFVSKLTTEDQQQLLQRIASRPSPLAHRLSPMTSHL